MTLIQYRATCSVSSGRVGTTLRRPRLDLAGDRPAWLVSGPRGLRPLVPRWVPSTWSEGWGSGFGPRLLLQPRFARWGCSVPPGRGGDSDRGVLEGVSRGAPHDRPRLFSGPHLLRRPGLTRDRRWRCGPCPAVLEPLPCLTGTPSTPLAARRAVLPSDDSRRCFNRAPSRWCRRKTCKGRPNYEPGPPRGVSS